MDQLSLHYLDCSPKLTDRPNYNRAVAGTTDLHSNSNAWGIVKTTIFLFADRPTTIHLHIHLGTILQSTGVSAAWILSVGSVLRVFVEPSSSSVVDAVPRDWLLETLWFSLSSFNIISSCVWLAAGRHVVPSKEAYSDDDDDTGSLCLLNGIPTPAGEYVLLAVISFLLLHRRLSMGTCPSARPAYHSVEYREEAHPSIYLSIHCNDDIDLHECVC